MVKFSRYIVNTSKYLFHDLRNTANLIQKDELFIMPKPIIFYFFKKTRIINPAIEEEKEKKRNFSLEH